MYSAPIEEGTILQEEEEEEDLIPKMFVGRDLHGLECFYIEKGPKVKPSLLVCNIVQPSLVAGLLLC